MLPVVVTDGVKQGEISWRWQYRYPARNLTWNQLSWQKRLLMQKSLLF